MSLMMAGVVYGTFVHNYDYRRNPFFQRSMAASTIDITNATGRIVSLQNDESGNPAWIASGRWNMKSSQGNQTQSSTVPFNANINMYKIDGTANNKGEISDFKLTRNSTNSLVTILNGTATISLKDGPVMDVPISIKILPNRAVSIWIDPVKVHNQFGNTPIYGNIDK